MSGEPVQIGLDVSRITEVFYRKVVILLALGAYAEAIVKSVPSLFPLL
jgi:hypothetical protein